MKSPNPVVFPLIRKQDILKPFPYSLAITLTPHRNINVPDLIDPDQPCAKVVEAEATFNEIGPLLHILNLQGYPKPPETPLQLPHPPLRSLTVGKY